jgi:hypothetical protein
MMTAGLDKTLRLFQVSYQLFCILELLNVLELTFT